MVQSLDIFTSVLGEDVPGPRRLRPRRSLAEAARALVGDNRSPQDRWFDDVERRLKAAMRSAKRTHGTPRQDRSGE
jgi:hypothetical protein